MKFWAKTNINTDNNDVSCDIYTHCKNTGNIAYYIAKEFTALFNEFGIDPETIAFFASLHDIGKISPGFQQKSKYWMIQNNLEEIKNNFRWDILEKDHGKITQYFLEQKFKDEKVLGAENIAAIIGAHHGKIKHRPSSRPYELHDIYEDNSGINWYNESNELFQHLKVYFNFLPNQVKYFDKNSSILWCVAGLITISDWIASLYTSLLTKNEAYNIIKEIGFGCPNLKKDLSFKDIFGYENPNKTQELFYNLEENGQRIYIIEDSMGNGKTEAALWKAYELISKNKANGIYFALPTQATSNRIHLRIINFLENILQNPQSDKNKLIHGNSWLDPNFGYEESYHDDSRDWFIGNKRSLLSKFGVGTIDQTLLSVLCCKHFFIRKFALAGKVIILDEIHSYDLYTGTLINELINTLSELGCTIIILSATLSKNLKNKLFTKLATTSGSENISYPLITCINNGKIKEYEINYKESKEIKIKFDSRESLREKAIDIAKKGGTVLWICNTVAAAQDDFKSLNNKNIDVGLLHARFPLWKRNELEKYWMSKLGKENNNRKGCILISTQIVEQSVDLDADFMVSELAPTDFMLQRIGRLWRHKRNNRKGVNNPRISIIEESLPFDQFEIMNCTEIRNSFGSKSKVYDPYILLRSWKVLKDLKEINIPQDMRKLIDNTYSDSNKENDEWSILKNKLKESEENFERKAKNNMTLWNPSAEDKEGIQTRLNNIPYINIIMCKEIKDNNVTFLNGTTAIVNNIFNLNVAKQIHNNIIKVQKTYLKRGNKNFLLFNKYVDYDYCIGIINKENVVTFCSYSSEYKFIWNEEQGLIIKRNI